MKLLDRFVRRIYKVRQADRNRIVRQLTTLLRDSGDHHIIRFDIQDCYESIKLADLVKKMEDDSILAPQCIKIFKQIHNQLSVDHTMDGLPRGLTISPTLAELYLRALDRKIAAHENVIYTARYVDDIVVIIPKNNDSETMNYIKDQLNELGLKLNSSPEKSYSGSTKSAKFDYLGYSIEVTSKKDKPNNVELRIAKKKLDRLKKRVAISLNEFRKSKNFQLLKRRLEYLCMLKTVRKGKNGNLLAGLAHNYQYVTDDFSCLKSIDGFLCNSIKRGRYCLSPTEIDTLKKISIYGNTKKRNVGKFSNKQTIQIMQAWKNA